MLFVSIMAFSTVMMNLYCGIRVYRANRAARTNRLFLVMCTTLCLWGFGYTFMISAESAEAANLWRIFSATGWCFLYGAFLLFAISLTENRGILSKPTVQGLLLVPSFVFFVNTTRYTAVDFVRTTWGWMYPYSNDMFWHLIFLMYYSCFAAWSLWLIFAWGRRSKTKRVRKQAEIIVKSTLAVYALGAPTDTLLPMLGLQIVPVGIIFSTIFTVGIWFSITRYRLMTLSFKTAADHILSNMMDPLLLVGEDLRIKEVNRNLLSLTGKSEQDLIGVPVNSLLLDTQANAVSSSAFFAKDYASITEVLIENLKGAPVPCLMSTRVLYDEFGDIVGIILLLQDITDRKKYEGLLKQTNEELEAKVRDRTQKLAENNISLQKEIAERKAAQDQIWYNANHDFLTDLPNRRLFYNRLKKSIERTKNTENVLTVIFIDLEVRTKSWTLNEAGGCPCIPEKNA